MKEKYEIHLDSRQVSFLVFGSMVVLGLVFVAGVVTGKRAASFSQPVSQSTGDVLSSLDEKHDKQIEESLKKQEEQREQPQQQSAVKPDAGRPQVQAQEIAAAGQPPAKPEEPSKGTAENLLGKKLDQSLSKLAESGFKAPAEKPKPEPEKKETPAAGDYTLQVGAVQDEKEAEKLRDRLKSKRYEAYILMAELPGMGKWYRVRIGSFATRDEAETFQKEFTSKEHMNALVTPKKK